MAHFKFGNTVHRVASTVSSGGTLTLTNASQRYQQITGTSNHTVVLPDATTLPKGLAFVISNRGTGTVTVNFNGGSLASTIAANAQKTFIVFDNVTAPGDWDVSNEASTGSGASVSTADKLSALAALGDGKYSDAENTAERVEFNVEEAGADAWLSKSALLAARNQLTSFSLNGHGYEVGGYNATEQDDSYRYDVDNNYWITRALFPVNFRYGIGWNIEGTAYIYGGVGNDNKTVQYDDSTNAWTTKATSSIVPNRCSGFVLNGYGYASGDPSFTKNTVLYNSVTDSYSSRALTVTGRQTPGGSEYDRFGYIVGGFNGAALTSVERYDDVNNAWRAVKSLNVARSQAPAFTLNGQMNTVFADPQVATAESYLDSADYWKTIASSSQARSDAGNMIFVAQATAVSAGGNNSLTPQTTVEQYKSSSFILTKLLKRSALTPSSILVSTSMNDLAVKAPVRLRTDGNAWKLLESNRDSALKLSETLSAKFQPSGLLYAAGGTSLTANDYYDIRANTWTARTAQPNNRFSAFSWGFDGYSFIGGGSTSTASMDRYNDISNSFTSRAAHSFVRARNGGFVIGDKGYHVTGADSGNNGTNGFERYNHVSNAWTTLSVFPASITGASVVSLKNRGWVITGGTTTTASSAVDNVRMYDADTDSWTSKAVYPAARINTASFSIEDFIYTFGGYGTDTLPKSGNAKYNQQLDSWTVLGNMLSARGGQGSGSIEGLGYSLGGENSGALSTVDSYNPLSDTWTNKAGLLASRDGVSKYYAPGAYRNYELQVSLPSYVAGLGANAWITKSSLPANKRTYQMFNLVGFVYSAGGFSGSATALNDRYDLINNTWLREASRPVAAYELANASLLGYGYSTGGFDPSESTGHYQYDADSKAWTTKASISPANASLRSAALNGFLYRLGGRESSTAVNRVEQYNASTNAWTAKTGMSTQRGFNSVFHVPGFLVAAGGQNSGATKQSSTEHYNDAANTWTTKASLAQAKDGMGTGSSPAITGVIAGDNGPLTNEVEQYMFDQNIFVKKSNYPQSVTAFGGADVEQVTVLAGGHPGSGEIANVYAMTPSLNNLIAGLGLRVTES